MRHIISSFLFLFFVALSVNAAVVVDMDKAISEARKISGGNIIVDYDIDEDNGDIYYEIAVLSKDSSKIELKLSLSDLQVYSRKNDRIDSRRYKALSKTKIDYKTAITTATANFSGSTVTSFDLETRSGTPYYEVKFVDNKGYTYKAYVDAEKGGLISVGKDSFITNPPAISIEDANKKALQSVKGTVYYTELDEDHRTINYEVKIISDDLQFYNVKVDANNGNIIRIKKDD